MPFGTITSQTKNFPPRTPGTYVDEAVAFGQPTNEFRIRGASGVGKDGRLRASVTRVIEKDIVSGSTTTRVPLVVVTSINVHPTGFTASEIDSAATDCSNFLTTDTITRLLMGES